MANANEVILSLAEATSLAERALAAIGFTAEESREIALPIIDAELCGYASLGLTRILTIADIPRVRQPRSPVRIVHETPVSALVDGGNHVGFYALQKAARIAIGKAEASRMSLVGVHNSYLSGRNAYYLEMIAKAGFIGIHLASGPGVVVPFGGKGPVLGTNPIAFAIPRAGRDPFIFDMGTSATTHGDLVFAARMQQDLPQGVAIDADGRPTTDPVAALAGGILPFGGYRGYGLGLSIQALCLLAGASLPRGDVQDFGFLFIVADPALLMAQPRFERDLQSLLRKVAQIPAAPGGGVRIPSQRAFAERARRRVEGIGIPGALHDRLLSL